MDLNVLVAIGAGIAVATGIGAGIGIGIATAGLVQAIARQPEASGKITPMFFVGVALAESTAIYGLVIAILLVTRLG
jgi:F-type H+-transporting ATPase subunit c